jgi:hypothetical protein
MTAINIVLLKDAAHIFSDGASSDRDGVIRGISSKVFAFPNIKAVIGVRGSSGALTVFAHTMAFKAASFDDLRADAVTTFRDAIFSHDKIFAQSPDGTKIQVMVAGFSDHSGTSEYFSVSNFDDPDGSVDSFVNDPPKIVYAPTGPEFEADLTRIKESHLKIRSWSDFRLREFGIETMEVQRRIVKGRARRDGCVGGFIQLTSVDRENITSSIIHRWHEDKIGSNFFS